MRFAPSHSQADKAPQSQPPKSTNRGFLLAATHSGAGKTTLSIGLMAALRDRGLAVQPFKCGPDFIDPTLHQLVTGRISRNLDIRMCGSAFVQNCFNKFSSTANISVIEGVMGLFDGGTGSTASLAKTLDLPVILVVDTRSCAESIAAIVKGFESLDPELRLAGVILNRVGSDRHQHLLESAIKAHCQTPILGSLRRNDTFTIADRYLGLYMGSEQPLHQEAIATLAQTLSESIDLNRLLSLVGTAPVQGQEPIAPERPAANVRIAIARDEAFCFYYQDNLDILEHLGATLVPFSPLHDPQLPTDINALYLGGGYPELFAQQLSTNTTMLQAIRNWSIDNRPLYAECGGFMYLSQGITDLQDRFWPLVEIFPVKSTMQAKLAKLGYRLATTGQDASLFGPQMTLYGHEFHYSTMEQMPKTIRRIFTFDNGAQEGYQVNNTLGTYLHQHFGGNPQAAANLIHFCSRIKE